MPSETPPVPPYASGLSALERVPDQAGEQLALRLRAVTHHRCASLFIPPLGVLRQKFVELRLQRLGNQALRTFVQHRAQQILPRSCTAIPDIGGNTCFSGQNNNGSINVSANNVIGNVEFAFMGFFEARRRRWGGFVDYMYLDVSGSSSSTRNFDVAGHPLPGGVNANLDLNVRRVAFGANRDWFVPWYLDVGTGDTEECLNPA